MAQIRRETDPDIIKKLSDNFIEDGDYTKEIMVDEFERLMRLCPKEICVLTVFDNDFFVGFIIGYHAEDRDYSFIAQIYSVAENEVAQEAMNKFIEWSKSMGCNEIRAETERNSVQMIGVRRYGFNEHGVVMSKRI